MANSSKGKKTYFKCKIKFKTGTTKTGKDKFRKEWVLVDAQSVTESEKKVTSHLNNVAPNADWFVESSKESRITEVIE